MEPPVNVKAVTNPNVLGKNMLWKSRRLPFKVINSPIITAKPIIKQLMGLKIWINALTLSDNDYRPVLDF